MSGEIDVPELPVYAAWLGQGQTLPVPLRLPSLRLLGKIALH